MELNNRLYTILEEIRVQNPLTHHITNYVTVNDCANAVLAIGGSPVMADDPEEVEEMVSIASALVLNMGTLSKKAIEAFVLAGKRANDLGIPVVLDPVGAGSTAFKDSAVKKVLSEIKLSVLRGNMSEIKSIYGSETLTRGVDSVDNPSDGGKKIAVELAKRLKCTVVITGDVDIISDGRKIFCIDNGHQMLSEITGTGCMVASLIGVCCGTGAGDLYGAIVGVGTMGISGEKAYERLGKNEGLGSFKIYLMDEISNFSIEDIKRRGKIYEIR